MKSQQSKVARIPGFYTKQIGIRVGPLGKSPHERVVAMSYVCPFRITPGSRRIRKLAALVAAALQ